MHREIKGAMIESSVIANGALITLIATWVIAISVEAVRNYRTPRRLKDVEDKTGDIRDDITEIKTSMKHMSDNMKETKMDIREINNSINDLLR